MPLKKRNRVLLISVVILTLLVFAFVFLRPSTLNSMWGSQNELPQRAKKQGYVIAKNQSETFALEVPADWKVIQYPMSEGYISLLTVESSDYKVTSASDDVYGMIGASLVSGARLDISVIKSYDDYVPKPSNEILHQEPYTNGNIAGTYFIYKDSGLAQADFHELRFANNGQVYYIKITFNPVKTPDGEKLFRYLLSTLVVK